MSKRFTPRECARLTSDEGEFFFEDLFKLSFRNTVSVEDNTLRGLICLLFFEVGSVIDEFGDHILRNSKSAKCCDGDISAKKSTLVILFKSSTISTRDS